MIKITQLSQLDLEATYNYADYLTWQLDKAVELIKGKVMLMSPAPNVKHQSISWQLNGLLFQYFKDKECHAFAAPFDVRLYDQHKSIQADQDIYSVVQPDLSIICAPEKLTEQGCLGAPDWIIEILSPGNSKKEMQTKYALYQESGVKEYWMVYPYEKAVHQFVMDASTEKYQLIAMYAEEDYASPQVFPDLKIDLQEVFAE
ncbi:Uma2 family endonuclease [Methyloprofundus sp.]|uniref:Uma2 family endonuclease n=1 Tax=Methyloprofundus sp. TaxID=2020875 RepID=UPI003D136C00